MDLLREIYDWSKSLPTWQSDGLRRIWARGLLSKEDLDDLRALAKADVGIPDPKKRKPVPLSDKHISTSARKGRDLRVLSLTAVANVNAIEKNQSLTFAEHGITIIYGDNASGKSGYARVFKRACRARDQDDRVLSNIFLPDEQRGTPSATFNIANNGVRSSLNWTEGISPPEILSAVSVFDSRCARVYVDKDNDVAYMPYGLDSLVVLAQACGQIRDRLSEEMAAFSVDLEGFNHLVDNTPVGRLISSLSAETPISELERLSKLSVQEKSRRVELQKLLKEANPAAKAEGVRRVQQRAARLSGLVDRLDALIGERGYDEVEKIGKEWKKSQNALTLTSQDAFGKKDLLPGTGGEEWRQMYFAAKHFSEAIAYTGREFPVTHDKARCVLCQQILSDGAGILRSFSAYLKHDAARQLKVQEQRKSALLSQLVAVNLDEGLIDSETLGDFRAESTSTVRALASYRAVAKKRLSAAVKGLEQNKRPGKCKPLPDLKSALAALQRQLQESIDKLTAAAGAAERQALEAERAELEARLRLQRERKLIARAIKKLQMNLKLKRAVSAVSTLNISRKSTELNERAITEALRQSLNEEFAELGLKKVKTILERKTSKGRTSYKLRLDVKTPTEASVSSVLSEGEQRAIAIGSFLAEVRLGGGSCGLVFDDPVSSLDHVRREHVARRMVKEAKTRQVVVFTHDLFFLFLLIEAARIAGVAQVVSSVEAWGAKVGLARSEIPFRGKTVKDRIAELRNTHQALGKLHRNGDRKEYEILVRDTYEKLRETWERSVEEVLFAGVVQRFKQGIETQMLHSVTVDDVDYREVHQGMTRCSKFMHDQATSANPPIPDPDDLKTDIDHLEAFRVRVTRRKDENLGRRKALVSLH